MKRKIFLIIVAIFTYFFVISSYKAVERKKMISNDNVNVVSYGTSADSKYAYGFRVNKNSKISSTNVSDYNMLKVEKSNDQILFIPKDTSGSGKVYVFIEDLGKFNGNQVDLKLTYSWKEVTINGTKILPYMKMYLDKDRGLLFHYFDTIGYEIKYEMYSNGKPLKVDMSVKLGDIDYSQYFGIKTNDGSVNSIQTIDGSEVYYENSNGYHWVYDMNYNAAETTDRKYSARFELGSTNSFNLIIGPERDLYSYKDLFTPSILESINPNTNLPYYTEDVIKTQLLDLNDGVLSGNYEGIGAVTLEASAYGPYTQPYPNLFIRDIDNILKKNTEMKNLDDNVIYEAYTEVPLENRDFYYSEYIVNVDIPEEVDIKKVNVFNESNEDVTSYFDITHDKNKYTFKVKSDILDDDKFYSDTYQYKFITNLTENTKTVVKEVGKHEFSSIAKLTVKRGNTSEEALTKIVSTTAIYESEESDDIKPENKYKITTEVVNGTIDDSIESVKTGEDVTIKYKAKDGFVLVKIIIDGKEIEIGDYKDSYTFKSVDKDHSIKVVYEIENPKTGAFIGFGLFAILLIGFVAFNVYSKRKNKLYKI